MIKYLVLAGSASLAFVFAKGVSRLLEFLLSIGVGNSELIIGVVAATLVVDYVKREYNAA